MPIRTRGLWISLFLFHISNGQISQAKIFPTNDPRLVIETFAENLPLPVNLTFSPEGRLFFLERTTGNIRVFDQAGQLQKKPVMTVPIRLNLFEAGAMGMTLSPDFSEEGGMVYVSHVTSRETWSVSRFFEDGNGRGSNLERVMDFPDCFVVPSEEFHGTHNIGNIHFGPNPIGAFPEQVLYISFGDGGFFLGEPDEEDEAHPAQDASQWCGGLSFIDPDDPPDPSEAFRHNYCVGLRNSFDFCFHPLSGMIYMTENGRDLNDEVNQIRFGGNYGWPMVTGAAGDFRYVDPILPIPRVVAPTGICVYDGSGLPEEYRNQVFFCDWREGEIRVLYLDSPSSPNAKIVHEEYLIGRSDWNGERPLGVGLIDMTPGPDGWIYACGGVSPNTAGSIFRIRRRNETRPILSGVFVR